MDILNESTALIIHLTTHAFGKQATHSKYRVIIATESFFLNHLYG